MHTHNSLEQSPRLLNLTHRQRRFVGAYLVSFDIEEAALSLGYSPTYAYTQGLRLLSLPAVKEAIRQHYENKIVTPQELIYRLSDITRASFGDFISLVPAPPSSRPTKPAPSIAYGKKVTIEDIGKPDHTIPPKSIAQSPGQNTQNTQNDSGALPDSGVGPSSPSPYEGPQVVIDLAKAKRLNKLHLIKKFKVTRFGLEIELQDKLTAASLLARYYNLLSDNPTDIAGTGTTDKAQTFEEWQATRKERLSKAQRTQQIVESTEYVVKDAP